MCATGPPRRCSASRSRWQPGTVLAVLGANGAGKSTLARAVSGLVPRPAGRVFFEGRDDHRACRPTASASSA